MNYITMDNALIFMAGLGWGAAALLFILNFIAPRTKTEVDDNLRDKLIWLQSVAPSVFLKVKMLHESKQLPEKVDRYLEYVILLGEAFGKTFGGGSNLPATMVPTAKLIADGLHAGIKLDTTANPTATPVKDLSQSKPGETI